MRNLLCLLIRFLPAVIAFKSFDDTLNGNKWDRLTLFIHICASACVFLFFNEISSSKESCRPLHTWIYLKWVGKIAWGIDGRHTSDARSLYCAYKFTWITTAETKQTSTQIFSLSHTHTHSHHENLKIYI